MGDEVFCVGNHDDMASLDAARAALRALVHCSDDDERERVLAAAIRRALVESHEDDPSLEIECEIAWDAGYERCKEDLAAAADRAQQPSKTFDIESLRAAP